MFTGLSTLRANERKQEAQETEASRKLKEYLKKYEGGGDAGGGEGGAKKKRKKKKKAAVASSGVMVVDEDISGFAAPTAHAGPSALEDEDEDYQPIVVNQEAADRAMRIIEKEKERYKQREDGSGWKLQGSQGVGRARHAGTVDLSPPRRQRHDSPEDLSPPRSRRHDSPEDLSPPRRKRHDSPEDLSPPRRKRHDSPEDLPPPRRRHDSLEDLSPPRRKRHDSPEDLSPPRRRHDSPEDHPLSRRKRHDSPEDLSPPRRKRRNSPEDLSPPRRKRRNSPEDLSPPRRKRHDSAEDLSPPRRQRHDSPEDLSPPRRRRGAAKEDLSPPRRPPKGPALMSDGTAAGMISGTDLKKELEEKKMQDRKRWENMEASVSGRNAETVFRDEAGNRYASRAEYEEAMQERRAKKEKKHVQEAELEWGGGMTQKKKKQEMRKAMESEAAKPFARSHDADVDMQQRSALRWGDPMAHLVAKRNATSLEEQAPSLVDAGNKKAMKKSGFIIPQEVPQHSWIRRGVGPPPNRYGIKPGRHWDGVDRSNGFETKMWKMQQKQAAQNSEAFMFLQSDM